MSVQEFDNTQAYAEGWFIADCDGSDNGPWQLQKLDEEDKFPNDEAAWKFVYQRAQAGSAYHSAALDFLQKHNPQELTCIEKYLAEHR